MSLSLLAGIGAAPILPAFSTLGAFLAFCLAVALTVLWVQILRGPLIKLAGLSILRVHPFGWLNTVVSNVDKWLDATVKGTERAVTWSFHSLMWSLSTTAQLTADLAQATWNSLEIRKRHEVRQVGAQTGQSISPRVKTLEREYKGIDARLDRVEHREQAQRAAGAAAGTIDHATLQRGIDKVAKRVGHLAHEVDALEHANTHAGAKAKPGSVTVPRVKPRAVPRTRAPSRHWTDVITKAAAAGMFVYALSRLGLRWMTCRNVSKVGKRLCGINEGLLDALLAGSTLFVGTISLREFATELEAVTEEVAGLIHGFIRDD